MRQRLHEYLLTCDKCGEKKIVIHTAEATEPEGWSQLETETFPDEALDLCPQCTQEYQKALGESGDNEKTSESP